MIKKFMMSGAAMALASGGLAVVSSSPALAMCPPDSGYTLHSSSIRMPFHGVPVFKDGRGGTITVSRAYSGSVSFQVTAGAETEVGAIFAKAKVSVSASLTKTNSTTTTHTYSHHISAGKFGHAQYVSYGKKVQWSRWQQYTSTHGCAIKTVKSGTINFPSTSEGWYYWETSS